LWWPLWNISEKEKEERVMVVLANKEKGCLRDGGKQYCFHPSFGIAFFGHLTFFEKRNLLICKNGCRG
jgi:hypothetical protein